MLEYRTIMTDNESTKIKIDTIITSSLPFTCHIFAQGSSRGSHDDHLKESYQAKSCILLLLLHTPKLKQHTAAWQQNGLQLSLQ